MLKEFENNRLLKFVPFSFDKWDSRVHQIYPLGSYSDYCEEIKKTLSLPGCSCMWSESLSGFFLLSSQGT